MFDACVSAMGGTNEAESMSLSFPQRMLRFAGKLMSKRKLKGRGWRHVPVERSFRVECSIRFSLSDRVSHFLSSDWAVSKFRRVYGLGV